MVEAGQQPGLADEALQPGREGVALAAVVYAAITGAPPPPAVDRLAGDTMRPLSLVAAGLYTERFLAAIDAALAVEPERRPADHLEFRALMGDIDAAAPVELAPKRDLMHEPFVGELAGEREVTVPDHPLLSLGEAAAKAGAPKPAAATTRPAPPERAEGMGRHAKAPAASAPRKPSWVGAVSAGGLFGKRAAYGLVAGTCVLIGVGALALQFHARQAARVPPAAAQPTMPVVAPATASAVSPATTPTVAAAPRPTAAVAPTLTPTASAPTALTAPTPRAAASTSAGTALPAPATAGDELAAPATPAERQARCTEILQKASLERITLAETNYFKRECK